MRTRRCSLCRKKIPVEDAVIGQLRAFCSMDHLIEFTRSKAGKREIKKSYSRENRARKESLKKRSEWLREAQAAFNSYIRVRDRGKPCVSCGVSEGVLKHGGTFDAGHYRSVGSTAHLRFNTRNVHGQCKKCNRYLSGRIVDYRKNLITRIGEDKLNELENNNEIRKFDIEYLKRVKKIFSKKARFYDRHFR